MLKNGQVALITGAARRIGAAIAMELHAAGFNVVIHCNQSVTAANQLALQLNSIRPDSALVIAANLNNPSSCQTLIDKALKWYGRLDLLVNNASLFIRSDIASFNMTDWQSLFTVNVQAPFALSVAAFASLAIHNGSIINITDIHAEKPLKEYAVYCQTKAALLMQTKALAKEFAPAVRVNAVAPGAITWPENDNALNNDQQKSIIAQTLLKRHGEPVFIAQAVLALAENPFITGQALDVDGGRSIN